ncbi:hypothetical protein C6P45_003307 [Maudiozyma exigua]|uniref:RRM domain-containing protein n=1 Tax=Maudiozyma exigua TaxID=34358 RepID=A0A9P7BCI1_MAUEX|nr:hypothetical protein C6P45_003307 [Kazachstania exigua]
MSDNTATIEEVPMETPEQEAPAPVTAQQTEEEVPAATVEHDDGSEKDENSSENDSEAANLYNEEVDSVADETHETTANDNGEKNIENEEEKSETEDNDDGDDDEEDESNSNDESSSTGSDDSSDSSDDDDDESSADESETSKNETENRTTKEETTSETNEETTITNEDASTNQLQDAVKVDKGLLEKQMEYMKESQILDAESFKQLNDQQKVQAIIKLLNSNPTTKIPNSEKVVKDNKKENAPPVQRSEQGAAGAPSGRTDLSLPMNEQERELYEIYLQGENKITEMHNIPPKSRLFIGNLPLKNVAKDDLFRIFYKYGHILQINIKNAFGFIQYDNHQSVIEAIKNESDQYNFGKKLILEVSSSNARPQFDHGDHGTNNSSTFISTSKRPFDTDDYGSNYRGGASKRNKRRVPECLIFVRKNADRAYATEIFNSIKNGTGIETDMVFMRPRMDLWKLVNDAAFDGTWGVILVNKTHNVDIQTFYTGPQGETKFDEYVGVSAQDAVGIFNNLKASRKGGSGMQGPTQGGSYGYGQPPMNIHSQQQQGYYGGYGMPPPQQGYGMPPPQQGYGMPPPQQGYGMGPPPPQMDQNYGRYQNGQNYSNYQNIGMGPQNQGIPPVQQNNQLSALLGANPSQMNQQQLLGALQNLPPDVIANLLANAQQQQQQQPNQQQQLVGLLQSAQQQQRPQQSRYGVSNQPMGMSYNQERNPGMNNIQGNTQAPPPPPQQSQNQNGSGNNVQNLLDSLAKLQK